MPKKTIAIPPIAMPAMVPGSMVWVVAGETAPSGVVAGVFAVLVERVGDDGKRLETPEESAELVTENAVAEGAGVALEEFFDDSVAQPMSASQPLPVLGPNYASYWCLLPSLSTFSSLTRSSSSA